MSVFVQKSLACEEGPAIANFSHISRGRMKRSKCFHFFAYFTSICKLLKVHISIIRDFNKTQSIFTALVDLSSPYP